MSEREETDRSAFIKHLISQIHCPVCHHHYSLDDILLIENKDDLWFMAVVCPDCETRGLVFALVSSQQTLPEPIIDITPEELARFEARGAITIDDVLDFHEFLRDYGGDMAELLVDES
jgi:hypothetical protein